MRIKLLVLAFLFLFLEAGSVFAADAPILLSPSNNSTVTSSKLQWQAPSYLLYTEGSYYMVQVDDQQTFANPEKNNIYLTNSYYSPQLNPGIWYWRVKAKDVSGSWSNWSDAWSFILVNSTPTPTPTLTPTSAPFLSPSPTPTPSASANSSSFTVSNIPSQINSDQSFRVSVDLQLPNNPSTTYYLSSAFKKVDGTRYFGLTKFNADWIKYDSNNYLNQYKITTDSIGHWTDTMEVKPDISDSDYKGSGDYIFKVFRYTSNGSQTWSNEVTINIQEVNAQTPQPATSSKPTSQPSSSAKPSTSYKTTPSVTYRLASIAAVTTSSPSASSNIQVKSNQQINIFKILGIIFLLSGLIMIVYLILQSRVKSKPL